MSRDLQDETYYVSNANRIPVKWTAPEVCPITIIWKQAPLHTKIIMIPGQPCMYGIVMISMQALHYKKYSCKSDVWSFGALMYEIWSVGHKPFEQNTNRKASWCHSHWYPSLMPSTYNWQCIELVDSGYRLPPPPACPKRIYEVMINCWSDYQRTMDFYDDLLYLFFQGILKQVNVPLLLCWKSS